MSQHDYVIDNASGATVRADINSALSAIQSLNSGTSEPSSTVAGMLWLDTTGGAPYALKVRDAGNNHWLTLASITDPGSDGNLSVAAIEGTNVLSTGESGGTKFLREDGDGTCSFQNVSQTASDIFQAMALFTSTSSATPTITISHNISGITRYSEGYYNIAWDTDFANTDYYILATVEQHSAADRIINVRSKSASAIDLFVRNSSTATKDPTAITVIAFTN